MLTAQVAHTEVRPEHVLVDTGYENIRQVIAVEEQFGTQVLCPPAVIDRRRTGTALTRSRWGRQRKLPRLELRARLQTPTGRSRYAATAHHRRACHWHHQQVPWALSASGCADSTRSKMNGIWSVWLSTAAAWPELGCEKHHDRSVILFFLQECIHLTRIFPPASTFPSKLLTQVRQAPTTVAIEVWLFLLSVVSVFSRKKSAFNPLSIPPLTTHPVTSRLDSTTFCMLQIGQPQLAVDICDAPNAVVRTIK